MKHRIITFCSGLILLFISNNLQAQTPLDSLRQPIIRFFEGFSQLNERLFWENTTPDFVLYEAGMIWNNDTLALKIKANPSTNFERKNSFTFMHVEQKGDMAWLSYWQQAVIRRDDKIRNARWLESVVLVRQSGRWKIRMMHSTPMK